MAETLSLQFIPKIPAPGQQKAFFMQQKIVSVIVL
jgi:hypothetical protein